MSKPALKRWVCPRCDAGVLAPSRPRKDDVRRYCLDCSKKTGRLVERTCPALDKARATSTTARKARTAAKVARARESAKAKHSIGDLDLMAEARRFWALPTMKDARKTHRPRVTKLPKITWRRSARKWHTSGYCRPSWQEIVVTLGKDPHDAQGVLLHELVHAVLPTSERHGSLFKSTMRSAYREAFPERDPLADTEDARRYKRFWNGDVDD